MSPAGERGLGPRRRAPFPGPRPRGRRAFALAFGLALSGGCRGVLGIDELGTEAGDVGEGGAGPGPTTSSGGVAGAGGGTGGGPPPNGGASGRAGGGAGGAAPGCAVGGAGGAGGVGGAGGNPEPNDTPKQATPLAERNTCESAAVLEATMEDGGADWYAFRGTKNLCCGFFCDGIEASASVKSVSPVRVCYYMKPGAAVACPSDTEVAGGPVPGGYEGCCASNGTSVVFAANDADVLISVTPVVPGGGCFPYTLTYNY